MQRYIKCLTEKKGQGCVHLIPDSKGVGTILGLNCFYLHLNPNIRNQLFIACYLVSLAFSMIQTCPYCSDSFVNRFFGHSIHKNGGYSEDMIPTVGFNMRKVTKGNVTIKLWDLGGQRRFRTMWERYCRGVSAIIYVVDAADRDSVPISRTELHDLLSKPSLSNIPLLVLGNKIDKSEALSKSSLTDQLGLDAIKDREVCCYMISCRDSVNIDMVIDWLIKHAQTTK
ncbi:hypothetical protein DM860_017364 [Cuscuta australis]|uniref:Uncharacterized protein n=1 Tax=Cuscuta australis TaxID=267555 RepID=A0A328DHJ2_9ASTE|nr:hypothetical protein DM860_017364 [Cuscuta australis]